MRPLPILMVLLVLIGSLPFLPVAGANPDLEWELQTTPVDITWLDIEWSPELSIYAAVGREDGTGTGAMTSPDGENWTAHSTPTTNTWFALEWSPELGLFAAVASTGGIDDRVMTSPDGQNWTARTTPVDNEWRDIVWSPSLGLFVAVSGTGFADHVMTSPDGISWTSRTTPAGINWLGVTWSEGDQQFVAVGDGSEEVMRSSDGINWATENVFFDKEWNAIVWAENLTRYVAVASRDPGETPGSAMTSPDGITWTEQTIPDGLWRNLEWSPELQVFVATQNSLNSEAIVTSPNGEDWAFETLPDQDRFALRGVSWSPSLAMFATVALADHNGQRVLTGTDPDFPTITITSAPNSVNINEEFDVTVLVENQTEGPLEGRTVSLVSEPEHFFEFGTTDANGEFTFTDLSVPFSGEIDLIAVEQDGASDTHTLTVVSPLPDGWSGTAPNPAEPAVTYPNGTGPAGVSIATHRTTHSWILATGFQSAVQGQIQVQRTTDRFQSSSTTILNQASGSSELGGLSWNTNTIRGCWTHTTGSGTASINQFFDHDDNDNWRTASAWTRGVGTNGYCDTGQIRDRPSDETIDNAIIWNDNDEQSRIIYANTGLSFALPPVLLPSGGQVGTDLISFVPKQTENTLSHSARLIACTAGNGDIPLEHTGIHLIRAPSFARQGTMSDQHFFFDTLESRTTNTQQYQACDVAISNTQNIILIWHDPNRNQVRTAIGSTVSPLDTQPAFTMNETVTHIRIDTAGQGNYIGSLATTNGAIYAFSTTNNGQTWTVEQIASDLLLNPANSTNHFQTDIAFDHGDNRFIVTWTAESGVRIAHTEFIPSVVAVDPDRTTSIENLDQEGGAFVQRDEFIGVNLEESGTSTGLGTDGVRLLISALLGISIVWIVWLITGRFDMAVSGGGGISIIVTAYWGLIPFWLFLILILISGGFFMAGARAKGGGT